MDKLFSLNLVKYKNTIYEFLSVAFLCHLIIFSPFVCLGIFIWCFITENILIKILATIYLVFLVKDKDVGHNGGKGIGVKWFKNNFAFNGAKNYFPVNLVKTTDLPSDKNYLFAIFPHGVLCFGVIFNFVSPYSDFYKLFPKIRPKVLTLNIFFHIPFVRHAPITYGAASASKKCLNVLLSASNNPNAPENSDGFTSNAVCLVVGGANEMLLSRPNEYRLIVRKRKGFIKQALINGCQLVPVFSFGEVNTYDQPPNPPGSKYRKFQELTKKLFSLPFSRIIGTWGIIPKKCPITTVVGEPIDVKKNENPSEKEIDELHKIFIEKLVNLFETHKQKYIHNHENVKLILE